MFTQFPVNFEHQIMGDLLAILRKISCCLLMSFNHEDVATEWIQILIQIVNLRKANSKVLHSINLLLSTQTCIS